MRKVSIAVAAVLCTLPVAPVQADPSGAFTAVAAPFPYPGWDDGGHRCNAGIEPLHKTARAFTAPFDGLLTVGMDGFIGDWDVFIVDEAGAELLASNKPQDPTTVDGTERTTALLRGSQTVGIVACNQLGGPIAEISYNFEPFPVSAIAATVGVGDAPDDSYFFPQAVTVNAGEAVAWQRVEGSQPHTVTQDDLRFRAGTVIGGTYARTFDEPGVYYYFCEYHGLPAEDEGGRIGQWGKITVVGT